MSTSQRFSYLKTLQVEKVDGSVCCALLMEKDIVDCCFDFTLTSSGTYLDVTLVSCYKIHILFSSHVCILTTLFTEFMYHTFCAAGVYNIQCRDGLVGYGVALAQLRSQVQTPVFYKCHSVFSTKITRSQPSI